MKFTKTKLPLTAATEVRKITPSSLGPYQVLLAPVYLFLERNERYLAIKRPLDFFTEEKWNQVKNANIYWSPFIDVIGPFKSAAMRIRAVLEEKDQVEKSIVNGGNKDAFPRIEIGRASFDLSKIALQNVGPLWDKDLKIEPYFAIAFAETLCHPLPKELLIEAREQDVEKYECALLKSSWAVFLLLHLGYGDLHYLSHYRERIFREDIKGELGSSTDELSFILSQLLVTSDIKSFHGLVFKGRDERTAQKLASRLEKVSDGLIKTDQASPSIFGAKGFCDV